MHCNSKWFFYTRHLCQIWKTQWQATATATTLEFLSRFRIQITFRNDKKKANTLTYHILMNKMSIILTKVEAKCPEDCSPFWMNITCSLCEELPLVKNISRIITFSITFSTFGYTVNYLIPLNYEIIVMCGYIIPLNITFPRRSCTSTSYGKWGMVKSWDIMHMLSAHCLNGTDWWWCRSQMMTMRTHCEMCECLMDLQIVQECLES